MKPSLFKPKIDSGAVQKNGGLRQSRFAKFLLGRNPVDFLYHANAQAARFVKKPSQARGVGVVPKVSLGGRKVGVVPKVARKQSVKSSRILIK
ncbi:MAG: hypothetical protein PHQ98_03025 [Candidatus ainarchaeum sp.]|nr:hypothetical protein [Candidatus ainarchaeum sp.]